MRIRTFVFALSAFSAATSIAAALPPSGDPSRLSHVAARMESQYPGEVIAIQSDTSGDKRAHYHVDMRFPGGSVARLDVDAVTLAVVSRESAPLAAGSATLPEATALVAAHLPGEVLLAEFDSTPRMSPHYDIDVRLPRGEIARLRVDPATREIAWRQPAIIVE